MSTLDTMMIGLNGMEAATAISSNAAAHLIAVPWIRPPVVNGSGGSAPSGSSTGAAKTQSAAPWNNLPASSSNFAEDFLKLLESKVLYNASAEVIKTDDQTLGRLLDTCK